jgi:hypothetical protein
VTADLAMTNGIIDDELVQIIREDKLAILLASDVMSMEEHWVDYEMEETQVKIDLSDAVMGEMISEIVSILKS